MRLAPHKPEDSALSAIQEGEIMRLRAIRISSRELVDLVWELEVKIATSRKKT